MEHKEAKYQYYNRESLVHELFVGNHTRVRYTSADPEDSPERYYDLLKREVASCDAVISEYMPQEFDENFRQPTFINEVAKDVTGYDLRYKFFSQITDWASQFNKDIYCLDPAHDKRFALFRVPNVAGFLSIAPFIIRGADALASEDKITRRKFLKHSLIASPLLISGVSEWSRYFEKFTGRSPLPTEALFRRIVVARGTQHLVTGLEKNSSPIKNLLMIYAPPHGQVINHLLQNPKELNEKFSIVSTLKDLGPDFKKSFFTQRHFRTINDQMCLVDEQEIV